MKRFILLCVSALLLGFELEAQVTYQPSDSIRVETLLAKGAQQAADANLVMFYAKELIGVPYVAQTLEVNSEERLVVNLRELDCTTYVETVLALTLTSRHGGRSFADYCRWLRQLRYEGGQLYGYASRNHYFSQWISSNVAQGLVTEIVGSESDRRGAFFPFVEPQVINLNWMTNHVQSYPMMAGKPQVIERIRRAEQAASGMTVRYIPQRLLGRGKSDLGIIHDGDILAIVTNKQGLDTSHLGFAVWGSDGKLHLLNASQIHKKVVLEPMTLATYMSKHPSQQGVRAVRLLDN
ncbi:MAG: DUF1460 domain-containing protein [Bacteroidaceae bacterium]|nr:DUF1460 domain-containing protein [Bacteroidaceae bacterium]